jgi:hypothetical protein
LRWVCLHLGDLALQHAPVTSTQRLFYEGAAKQIIHLLQQTMMNVVEATATTMQHAMIRDTHTSANKHCPTVHSKNSPHLSQVLRVDHLSALPLLIVDILQFIT